MTRQTVGIQLRVYDAKTGDPEAVYEAIFRTEDWEKDRMKYIKMMEHITKKADEELEERQSTDL